MIFKIRSHATLLAAVTLAATSFASNSAAAQFKPYGDYASSFKAPNIFSAGSFSSSQVPVKGSPPHIAYVTTVQYKFSYSYPRAPGFQALICNNSGTICHDTQGNESGRFNFTGKGVRANQPLRMFARVDAPLGTKGSISPIYGSSAQLIVKWEAK